MLIAAQVFTNEDAAMTDQDTPTDDFKELCRLCNQGRLYEVEVWCKAGRPVDFTHWNPRLTPIGIAIDRRFHSLVELLLRNGASPSGGALRLAVRQANLGIVELLFRFGADWQSVAFKEVIRCAHPGIVKMFIERGADIFADYPIAEGLKLATKAFLGVYKDYIDRFPQLRVQAAIALRHFCAKGSMRGVCLLLWAGADPHLPVPRKFGEPADLWESACEEAKWKHNADILRKLEMASRAA